MATQIELTTKKTSYVHSLFEHKDEIDFKVEDRTVNVSELKQFVRDIIISTNDKALEKKSVATKKFLISLDRQKSKQDILFLVWNSMMKGDGLGVN